MSFGRFQASGNGDGLTLSRPGISLTLDGVRPSGPGVPAEVIVGIRPEHTHIWREGDGLLGPIGGRAEFVEMLGREALVGVVAADDLRFTVRAEADSPLRPGDRVDFGLEPGRVHLFDPETERALSVA
jgi:multiple sugar transport system ATP-binding protein